MANYPNLNLQGHTQASTYGRVAQVSQSFSQSLFLPVSCSQFFDGFGNSIDLAFLSVSYAQTASFAVTTLYISQSITSSTSTSSFAVSASWASRSLSASVSSTASYLTDFNGDFIRLVTGDIKIMDATGDLIELNTGNITISTANNAIIVLDTGSVSISDDESAALNLNNGAILLRDNNEDNILIDTGSISLNSDDLINIQGGNAVKINNATNDSIVISSDDINIQTSNGTFIEITGAHIELATATESDELFIGGGEAILKTEGELTLQDGTGDLIILNNNDILLKSTTVSVSSSLHAPSITGSLLGTSSWAISASWAPSAAGGTTLVTASTYQITSSWASASIFSTSASFASKSLSSISASWASASLSSSFLNGNATASVFGTSSNAVSASWAPVPISASWASASLISITSSFASSSNFSISASWASKSLFSNSSSFASASISSSYTVTASYALNGNSGTSIGIGSVITSSISIISGSFNNVDPGNIFGINYTFTTTSLYRISIVALAIGNSVAAGTNIFYTNNYIDEMGSVSVVNSVTINGSGSTGAPIPFVYLSCFSGVANTSALFYWTSLGTITGSIHVITKMALEKLI